MSLRSTLVLRGVILFLAVASISCERGAIPTAIDDRGDFGIDMASSLEGSAGSAAAGRPALPPGIRNLPPQRVMRMELVDYPAASDVGGCFTQIANPGWMAVALPAPWLDRTSSGGMTGRDFLARWLRADPYWLYRLDIEFPEPAWAEAEGRVALLQYRIRDQNGYIHRMARCVIPASQLAVDHLRLRFSQGRSDQAFEPGPGTSSCSEEVVVSANFRALQSINIQSLQECAVDYCLDPIVVTPYCDGWGTEYDWELDECVCMDPYHEMDEYGDCALPEDDSPPPLVCPDPDNPECDDGGTEPPVICPDPFNPECGDGEPTPPPPPPPPPAPDSMTVSLTLSPTEVTPGGVTEVIVQVDPAQAGVPVDVWTSASGDGVGVFGESSDLTDENGVFSTTYTAGSAVHVETIWAAAINNDGEILEASADLTVAGLFEASLECDTGVTRGEYGGCTLTVSDESFLDEIIRWKFEAASLGLDSITSPHSGSTWDGNLVSSGTVTAFFRTTDGTEHDRSDHLYIEPRQWSFVVTGSPPPLGLPDYGDEPITDIEVVLGENLSAQGSPGFAPEGAGQWQVSNPIQSGPNEGLAYVTSHNYSSERSYWVNQWFKPDWWLRTLHVGGQWYNPYEVEQLVFGGNPDLFLHGVAAHEWTSLNSHQRRLRYSVENGCGNVAAYIERVVARPEAIPMRVSQAQSQGGLWLKYEAGHNFVHGNYAAYGVWRLIGTNDAWRHFSMDGQIPEPAPTAPCVR
jgi:hypothetical protein